jgi:hypothetical protein
VSEAEDGRGGDDVLHGVDEDDVVERSDVERRVLGADVVLDPRLEIRELASQELPGQLDLLPIDVDADDARLPDGPGTRTGPRCRNRSRARSCR